jgi:DNA-directed RNA polymerase subunit RPC12/RpoP
MLKEEQSNIGNCPHCTRIIFKDAVFNSEASFSTRCPHCNKAVRVIIKHKVEITLIAVQDDHKPKKIGTGPGIVVLILVLYLPPIIYRLADNMDNILDILT